jgi:chromosome segregation ATPase
MECAENCHGKAKDFTICSACRTGYEAEIERLRAALEAEVKNLNHSLEDACREVEARRNHGKESAKDTDRMVDSANKRIEELEADNERLLKRIAELEARHEKFLYEFWQTNADNERLRAALLEIIEFGSDIVAVTIAEEALAAVEGEGDA